jgi:thiamine pyrophosphokinase
LFTNQAETLNKTAIVVANGDPQMGLAVRRIIENLPSALVICADGGADVALSLGLQPMMVVGDMDSVQPSTLQTLENQGARIIRQSPHKDETDLELALIQTAALGVKSIFILAALGQRLDQTLSNIYMLTLPAIQHCDVRLVAANQTAWLIGPGTHTITGQPADTVSLVPFGGDVHGIVTDRLEYPLRDEPLYLGPARGVSNVMLSTEATVTFKSGTLLVVHTIGRA